MNEEETISTYHLEIIGYESVEMQALKVLKVKATTQKQAKRNDSTLHDSTPSVMIELNFGRHPSIYYEALSACHRPYRHCCLRQLHFAKGMNDRSY